MTGLGARPGTFPDGRFPASSMTTIHVRGWLGSFVRVRVGNSERSWMEGAITYGECSPAEDLERATWSKGSSSFGSYGRGVGAPRAMVVGVSRPGKRALGDLCSDMPVRAASSASCHGEKKRAERGGGWNALLDFPTSPFIGRLHTPQTPRFGLRDLPFWLGRGP